MSVPRKQMRQLFRFAPIWCSKKQGKKRNKREKKEKKKKQQQQSKEKKRKKNNNTHNTIGIPNEHICTCVSHRCAHRSYVHARLYILHSILYTHIDCEPVHHRSLRVSPFPHSLGVENAVHEYSFCMYKMFFVVWMFFFCCCCRFFFSLCHLPLFGISFRMIESRFSIYTAYVLNEPCRRIPYVHQIMAYGYTHFVHMDGENDSIKCNSACS